MNLLLIIDPLEWRISQFTQIPVFSLVERKDWIFSCLDLSHLRKLSLLPVVFYLWYHKCAKTSSGLLLPTLKCSSLGFTLKII